MDRKCKLSKGNVRIIASTIWIVAFGVANWVTSIGMAKYLYSNADMSLWYNVLLVTALAVIVTICCVASTRALIIRLRKSVSGGGVDKYEEDILWQSVCSAGALVFWFIFVILTRRMDMCLANAVKWANTLNVSADMASFWSTFVYVATALMVLGLQLQAYFGMAPYLASSRCELWQKRSDEELDKEEEEITELESK